MNQTLTYAISETENLIFSGVENKFELYSKAEGSSRELIARFEAGKWSFENEQQKKLFLALFDNNRVKFFKAIKVFQRSLKELPKLYEFTCIRRRISIKITKLKRNFKDKVQDIFYPYQPRTTYQAPEAKDHFIDRYHSIKEMD
jgi:hypothetical protein